MRQFSIFILLTILLIGCKPKEASKEFSFKKRETVNLIKASTAIDLVSKGIGPISDVQFSEEIDVNLVSKGEKIYEEKCTACHKIGSTFIGPPPNGILKRRTPEWVMNMMLNPDEMIKNDSLAKALFMEFNGQLMTNQNLTKEESRSILEYFRTL